MNEQERRKEGTKEGWLILDTSVMLFNLKLSLHKMNWGRKVLGTVKVNGNRPREKVMVVKGEGDRREQKEFIFPFSTYHYSSPQDMPQN